MCTEFYIFYCFCSSLPFFCCFFAFSLSLFLRHLFITFWASVLCCWESSYHKLRERERGREWEFAGERIIVYYDLRNKWPLLWGNEVISVCFAIEWNAIWCLPANDKIRKIYISARQPKIRVAGSVERACECVWNNGNDIFFPSYFSIIYHRKSKYT